VGAPAQQMTVLAGLMNLDRLASMAPGRKDRRKGDPAM